MRQEGSSKLFDAFIAAVLVASCVQLSAQTVKVPQDPGIRGGAAGAGSPLPALTPDEIAFFKDGLARFAEIEVVTGGNNNGLGPRFNSNQCLSCHSQPAAGGSSPARNPLIAVATLNGARNMVPWFIAQNGPVREARFKRNSDGTNDGEVHDLFVITGRSDAVGCNIAQPSFLPAGNPLTGQGGNPNIIFRIPTPMFGGGLIEAIPDSAILANMKTNPSLKAGFGHLRSRQCAPERQCEYQRKRRDDYALRMEGTKQVPAYVRGRGLQRRDGDHESTLPPRA